MLWVVVAMAATARAHTNSLMRGKFLAAALVSDFGEEAFDLGQRGAGGRQMPVIDHGLMPLHAHCENSLVST
jgi:hypothetical protein